MQCPKCGMNISDDAKFCLHCGTTFQPIVNQIQQSMANQTQQPMITQAPQTMQSNAPQGLNPIPTEVANQTADFVSKKSGSNKIIKIILILLLLVGAYFGYNKVKEQRELEKQVQEEFEKESGIYFQVAAILASSNTLVSEGKKLEQNTFYYVLVDEDMKDKEHPLSSKETKDKKLFDGKGYMIIIMHGDVNHVQGFVCFNNGNNEKRYTSKKTMNVYEIIDGSNTKNSFDNLRINSKGKCDIKELLGHSSQTLYQLTAKE